jgi:hypothetical protein
MDAIILKMMTKTLKLPLRWSCEHVASLGPYPPITILLTKDENVTFLATYIYLIFIYDNYTRSCHLDLADNWQCHLKLNDSPGNKAYC